MVALVITPPILSAIEAIPPHSREELNLPDVKSQPLGNPISHDQIIRVSRYFRDTRSPSSSCKKANDTGFDRSLDALLRGTKLYIPPPPPKPQPTPEYLAHKARLLAAAEADAYTRMLSPSHPSTSTSPTASNTNPNTSPFASNTSKLAALHDAHPSSTEDPNYTDPLTPSLVLNIFLSVLITGFSVYWALTSFRTPEVLVSLVSNMWTSSSSGRNQSGNSSGGGGIGASEPVRVLLSLLAALGVGVAEVAMYAIYLGKIESAREKERKVKERKEVMSRAEVGGVGGGAVTETRIREQEAGEEKEVIWGRGPNGGLRRRVREKWEEGEKENAKEAEDESRS
ncbi:TMEM199/VMA12 family protein [Aspergillus undulatus]|uniref:TMEM199/VMA12 family protein n=1 Tax=Aspergillus undulatus TaxID=1810928 RepID=UPI003CCDCC88